MFLTEFRVSEELFEEADKEGSAREFFFKLVELLSKGRIERRDLKRLPKEKQEQLIYELVKANGLESYFEPLGAKNIYNALRKAFRKKKLESIEKEWSCKLTNWREEFESLLRKVSVAYLLRLREPSKAAELVKSGWILPSDVFNSFLEFGERVVEDFDYHWLLRRIEKWFQTPPFKRREKIVRDTVEAYRLGCLELAIYALFPLSEGVVWDTFVRENTLEADMEALIRKRNRKFVTIQYAVKLILENCFGSESLPPFLDWVRFVDYREGELNRHAIQHGVAVNFGTRKNFFKLFLFVDFLHEIIKEIFSLRKGLS